MDCSSEDGECLFDSVPDKISVLPGQVVTPDDQCKDVFGQDSGICDVSLFKHVFEPEYSHSALHHQLFSAPLMPANNGTRKSGIIYAL